MIPRCDVINISRDVIVAKISTTASFVSSQEAVQETFQFENSLIQKTNMYLKQVKIENNLNVFQIFFSWNDDFFSFLSNKKVIL